MSDIEKRAKELGSKHARQYHHNNCHLTGNMEFVFSNEEITNACIEMAKEQREIDIARASELYCQMCEDFRCCDWDGRGVCPILENFKNHLIK